MSMIQTLVLTVIGEDRPGLVEAVSTIVSEHGANWEASHMARLGGRFAGILQLTVAEAQEEALTSALATLLPKGLRVIVENAGVDDAPEGHSVEVDLIGSDQPNIIRDITSTLAGRNITVLEISSELVEAPMAGGRLFRMTASLRCPADVQRLELRNMLESLANGLMVDITIEDD